MPGKTGGSGFFGLWIEHRRELDRWQQRLCKRFPGVFFQVPPPNWLPADVGERIPSTRRLHRALLVDFDARLKKAPLVPGAPQSSQPRD